MPECVSLMENKHEQTYITLLIKYTGSNIFVTHHMAGSSATICK